MDAAIPEKIVETIRAAGDAGVSHLLSVPEMTELEAKDPEAFRRGFDAAFLREPRILHRCRVQTRLHNGTVADQHQAYAEFFVHADHFGAFKAKKQIEIETMAEKAHEASEGAGARS